MEVGISQFEQGIGSAGDDTLTGNADANYFDAGPGRDVAQGLGGDDELYGGAGRDSLDGGEGTDRCPDAGATTVRIDCERPEAPRGERERHVARCAGPCGSPRWGCAAGERQVSGR